MEKPRIVDNVRRWLPRTGSLAAYLVALLLVAFGVLLRFPLDALSGGQPLPPYITLYPMIVIAAFAGGIRAGFVAMAASAATAWALWLAPPTASPIDPLRAATGIIFLFTGSATAVICGFARLLLDDVAANEAARARSTRESVHRIKNLLAVIQSISRKISKDAPDVAAYRERLEARLGALAVAQDILLKREWSNVALKDLLRSALGPFLPNPRLELRDTPNVIVPKQAVTQLSMALYELATNSAKYGALANPEGLVRIDTRIHDGRCALEWREVGLTQIAVGESAGLGASLIRTALSTIEDATVVYEVSPNSVACVFEWPVNSSAT
ncbi:MAG: sensor histidine kinase [Hyphomonadaceae bacterium]